MARYYSIEMYRPSTTTLARKYTSYPTVNGVAQNDPGALNVLIDAYVYSADAPEQQAALKVWGVPIQDIMQANDFTNLDIKVYAGFQKGLPLNNPAQAGLILQGSVFQSFANWQGTEQTLDLVVTVKGALQSQNSNVSFSWLAGAALSQALATTFTNAFPGVKQTINISDKLILSHDVAGLYPSLTAFAQFLRPITQEILGGSYPGVTIVMTPNGISALDGNVKQGQPTTIQTYTYNGVSYPVTDGSITVPATMLADQGFVNSFGTSLLGTATTLVSSKPDADGNVTFISVVPNGSQQVAAVPSAPPSDAPQAKPVQLAFQDLIGQPTWIASGIIQFVCPMRADLSVGAVVIMPKGILGNPTNPAGAPGAVVTTSASQPQARQSSLFSGNFFVTSVHHIGEFRNPDGQGWVTVFNAATQPVAS